NLATLTVNNCTFSGNSAAGSDPKGFYEGGAIYNDGGTLSVNHCTFNDNSVSSYFYALGGAIFDNTENYGFGPSTITNSPFTGNAVSGSGYGQGGGISLAPFCRITITDTTVSGNSASSPNFTSGGGIYESAGNSLALGNDIIAGNRIDGGFPEGPD